MQLCVAVYVRKTEICGIFTFSLFVCKQLVVLLMLLTIMTENKKRNIKREGRVFKLKMDKQMSLLVYSYKLKSTVFSLPKRGFRYNKI